jgi:crotonobetainyl-CoA:carnitine CoA-transferase CaiB-like acyl-CoA transferase
MVVDLPHAALGRHAALGLPIKLSDADAGPKRGAPLYGEHTRAVLAELGYGEAEIDALVESGAAIAAEPVPG